MPITIFPPRSTEVDLSGIDLSSLQTDLENKIDTQTTSITNFIENYTPIVQAIKSIQSGRVVGGSSYTNPITINEVDVSKSVVIVKEYTGTYDRTYTAYGYLESSTQLRVSRTHSYTSFTWQVIEFN